MNIRVNPNLPNNQQIIDTSGTDPVPVTRLSSTLSSQISSMNVGDVFTGQIQDLNGKVIELLLSDKSSVEAKLSNMMRLQIGQTMSFEVTSNTGGKVQLTPLYANLTAESQVGRALGEAGLEYDARNAEMVNAMMEQGMKIDSESLLAMARTVSAYPNAAPSSIVTMTALGIPLEPENVEQFEIYRNNAHQIAEHVGGLAEGYAELAGDSPLMNDLFLNIFTGTGDPSMDELLKEAVKLQAERGEIPEEAAETPEKAAEQEGAEAPADAGKDGAGAATGAAAGGETQVSEASARDIKAGFYGENTVTESLEELFTPEERSELASRLKEMGLPGSLGDRIENGDLNTRDTLNLIRSFTNENNRQDLSLTPEQMAAFPEKVKDLLKSPEYGKLMKNEIMNELLLKPEEVADKERINEYFRKVSEDTAKALQVLQSTGREDTTLAQGTRELHDNVDFMNQMNQIFTYVQIPLKMASEAQHGDLYVYTNKKKLMSGDGNVSALLHLDMTHLGTMDIHISMNPSGKVNTHFILQKEEMLDFIAEHLPELDDRLSSRGYHVMSDVSLNKEKTSVPEIMFSKGKNTKLIQHTAFDAKA